jgi:uncharacterized YigZ family protein
MMKTINDIATASVKILRSEFSSFLYPVDDVSKVKEIVAFHLEQHRNATHNCYAYVIGKKQEWQYYSDQGEPSGTAGKPILNILLKYELTNVLAVVTRYYGGIKLGIRGLIDAYSEAMEKTILNATLIEFHALETIQIKLDYSVLESLRHFLKKHNSTLNNQEFSDIVAAEIVYPEVNRSDIVSYLNDLTQKGLVRILTLT